jgi:FHS family L-fucose permease-like MFS transporter
MNSTESLAGPPEGAVRSSRLFVLAPFFVFGGITSLNDVVVPKLKALFTLNYGEVIQIQSAFFAAYFLISIPMSLSTAHTQTLQG